MRAIYLLLVLAVVGVVFANDGPVLGESGRVVAMRGEHQSIRMVREWVAINLYAGHYDVAATFVFHNEGGATSVQMGFPELSHEFSPRNPYRSRTGFDRFATWVDGTRVHATRQWTGFSKGRFDAREFPAYWVRTVNFAAGQTREVRVAYRSRQVWESGSPTLAGGCYTFTGEAWLGTVAETNLVVTNHVPGTTGVGILSEAPLRQRGNRFSARWTDWQAQAGVWIGVEPQLAGAMVLDYGPPMVADNLTHRRYVVRNPGRLRAPAAAPSVLLRDGMAYLSLRAFADRMGEEQRLTGRGLMWDAAAFAAGLEVDGRLIRASADSRRLRVGDAETIMPRPAFLSARACYDSTDDMGHWLYVPMRAFVEALGGTVTAHEDNGRVAMALPK